MANHKNFEWIILEKNLESVLQKKTQIICLVLAIPIFDTFEWKSVIYDILNHKTSYEIVMPPAMMPTYR